MQRRFKFYKQPDQMDCGPTCLKMVSAYYGKQFHLQRLRDQSLINREGVSFYGIANAAESIGLHTRAAFISINTLLEVPFPCILHWNQNHFVVLYKVSKNKFVVADPSKGIIHYNKKEFLESWSRSGEDSGFVLLLEPTPDFYSQGEDLAKNFGFRKLFSYIGRYRKLLFQLFLSFLIGSFLQVLLPFLTQSIVDVGIPAQDIGFIQLILIAQFALLISRTGVEFLRSWILLHISTRLNIFVLTDFLRKLFKLPIGFFDTKKTGDIMQRLEDQKRIESFLASQTLMTVFSFFSLLVFAIVLAMYDSVIFLIFITSTILYTLWILMFLRRRRELDFKRFDISAKNQSLTIQLIQGMQEIKLSGTERKKRWDWEDVQAKLFRFNIQSLSLGQFQQAGGMFFNEGKNLLIIFLAAQRVVSGDLSIGAMVAIQTIIGQLNSPVEQFLGFIQSYQDAKLSLNRLNEVFSLDDEQSPAVDYVTTMPKFQQIEFRNVTFNYPGNVPVLKNVNLSIPKGKVTAIVGVSGSGKSTLIKLLLGFYPLTSGGIYVGNVSLGGISPQVWKNHCGVVMQDSFIFSDTIAANIALTESKINWSLLEKAIELACLEDFIDSLPLGLKTNIGAEGNGISQGQRQRILIARAIYKQPELVLLDEATNSLDANNELKIVKNLDSFFASRTVVIVAHRLSTVRNADNIVVLDNGLIVEQGNHQQLTSLKGKYYELVKNQLELGN